MRASYAYIVTAYSKIGANGLFDLGKIDGRSQAVKSAKKARHIAFEWSRGRRFSHDRAIVSRFYK